MFPQVYMMCTGAASFVTLKFCSYILCHLSLNGNLLRFGDAGKKTNDGLAFLAVDCLQQHIQKHRIKQSLSR